MGRARLVLALIVALIAVFGYFGLGAVNPTTGERQHIALTQDQEIALGLQSAPEMADQFGGLDPDPDAQSLVQEVGKRVATRSVAGRSGYQFQFHLLADPRTINAFALPGGPVFVTRGLLQRFQNEAQLAGVLGHEIGHVIGRHSAEHLARGNLLQGLIQAIGLAGSDTPEHGRAAAEAAAVAAQMAQLRYGRNDEYEADTLGVRLMSEAGYDPRALIAVMRILEESSGPGGPPEFLSSHPDPGNRQGVIQEAISRHFPDGVPGSLTTGRRFEFLTP